MHKIRIRSILPLVCLLYSFPGVAQRLTKQKALDMAASQYAKQAELQKPALVADWEQKQVSFGEYQMKFTYRIFGEKPADGRSLYISLHGGGNTSARMTGTTIPSIGWEFLLIRPKQAQNQSFLCPAMTLQLKKMKIRHFRSI
ncbi:MAG TPA: hypothetical protein VK541_24675 [Pedobacter sp.]|uniref:hypothetical protein n=1 Tax=Pedobacter sp. TaxID=1411316 RepID=UPI002BA04A1F|nr:hypothetical protein [Pedobacter sp.]HMI05706.1 hypothetical protein [Pedobacter sp.]